MRPPLPPFEQWKYQYCACGNRVTNPSFAQSRNAWTWFSYCTPCTKLRNRYGFSSPEHALQVLGPPKCALCGCTDKEKLRIDHDHSTDRVRAWLCNLCNAGIGYFKEDPDLLLKAIAYCNRHRALSTMVTLCKDMGLKVDDHHIPKNSDAKPEKYKQQPHRNKKRKETRMRRLE